MGNLVPALFWFPPTAAGVLFLYLTQDFFGPGLYFILGGLILGWIALNFFGLYCNKQVRRMLEKDMQVDHPDDQRSRVFVGFASPKYHSMVDAHEDVGFLLFGSEDIEFIGDTRTFRMLRSQVRRVHFRPNVHTLVALGRWVCVEGVIDNRPVRLLVEPREKDTMLANLRLGKGLKSAIERWWKG